MKSFRYNMGQNKLGVSFSLLILIYMLTLYPEVLQMRVEVGAYPFIFLTLASVGAILNIVLYLTNSPHLHKLNEISFLKIENKKHSGDPSYEKAKLRREIASILSFSLLFGMIYLIGFLPSVFIFGFLFIYQTSKKFKKSICFGILLLVLVYLFSLILPGALWGGMLFY